MQSETLLEQDIHFKGNKGTETKSKKKAWLMWIQGSTLVLGFGLLVLVIYFIGYKTVLESLSTVGWGFIPIIALNVSRHFLRSFSMYLAIPREHRTFKYRSAVAARFGGEAISFLTFTGPFLGDATKAILLKRNITIEQGASAVLIDNVLYYVTVVLMIMAGVAGMVALYGTGSPAMANLLLAIVIGAIAVFVALILAIMFRVTPISSILRMLDKRGLVPKFVLKMQQGILDVETNVFHFYHHRRTDFFMLFGISSLVHVVSVCEVYLAVKLLGFEPFWSTAFIIESLTKVINVVFGFVPGTIGVYEGGNGLILHTLGYATAVGVALALIRRGAMIFSLFVGLTVLLLRMIDRTKTLVAPEAE